MIDDLIKRCNFFLWENMYSGDTLQFASFQHRDLVRTFFAGVMECMMLANLRQEAASVIWFYREMTQLDWLPDARFAKGGGN